MPKKTKKATMKTSNGVEYQIDGQYDFKQKYADWVDDCKGQSKEKIMSVGKKGNPKPENLYLQLEQHVTENWVRPQSRNKGKNKGVFQLLKLINKSMTQKDIYTNKDVDEIKSYIRRIKVRYEAAESSYNPRNILFTRKAKFSGSKSAGNFKIEDDSDVEIYGHYADDFFAAKYGGKLAPSSWHSTSMNTANPPLAQALFGKGNLITVGLLDVLEEAVKQLESMRITYMAFNPYRIGNLSEIKSVKDFVNDILDNPELFKNGSPKYSQIARAIEGKRFTVGGKSDTVTDAAKLAALPSDIESFNLQRISTGQVKALLGKIAGKTKKLESGDYLNIKGFSQVPVKKSWAELIRGY